MRLLDALARHDGVSIEEYLYTALLNLEVMQDRETIETLLPGFTKAMNFPE